MPNSSSSPSSSSSQQFTEHTVPLLVTNNCPDTIWPGIISQHGKGPGTGGFILPGSETRIFNVSWDWQGRVWGRTNCSFNDDGTGPGPKSHFGAACLTGDCGRLDCSGTGAVPSTLAEFNLWGGVSGKQTFYDISLVDGYNLPVGIVFIPSPNMTYIPPNLVNPSCIATAGWLSPPSRTGLTYTNATYPMPYEPSQTNDGVGRWCPWDLQRFPPDKPGDGVYPYPDDDVARPAFDPCLSACSATGSDEDCCTGRHNDPAVCRPSLYSASAKAVCPDAYTYAYDDQASTFIIPSGGGWEVVFCPRGRSTDILNTFGEQLRGLASTGAVTRAMYEQLGSVAFIESRRSGGARRAVDGEAPSLRGMGALAIGLWLVWAML